MQATPVHPRTKDIPDEARSGGERGYRPEIQGLRAVAALLVAVYHIWFGRVSGGVDVFFVVSAFLITSSLLRQVDSTGQVRFLEFWGGLARRLLPASMLVLFIVTVASVSWLPRPLWNETIQQVVASALYVQNWQLAYDAVDYLAQGMAASPVQHYWALSIQGQFYLIWPILIALCVALSARLGVPPRRTIAFAFIAVFICSLAFSVYATRVNQTFTYFNTFARLWELSLGAMLALAVGTRLKLGTGARFALGWAGLAGIVACGMIFQVSRAFPGYVALWPTVCAVLIVLAGTSGSRIGADRLLSWKPLVYLGGISYGLYLWHWPVLIFWRWFTHHAPIGLLSGLSVLGIAIALAAVSTRLVENPVRFANRRFDRRRKLAAFVAACSIPVLVTSTAWGAYYLKQKAYDDRAVPLGHLDYPGALAFEKDFQYAGKPNVPLYPGMLAVQDDLPAVYDEGCHRLEPGLQRVNCVYGDVSSSRSIALVGGSHSAHWLPALDLLGRELGWRVVVFTKSNCLFSVETGNVTLGERCEQWNERTLQLLLEHPPAVVVTTSTRGSGRDEHVPPGFLLRWAQLEHAGIKVIAIRDTPWMKFWVPECLEMKGHDSVNCAQPTDAMLARPSPVETLSERPSNVHFVDMSDYFCDETHCHPVIGNVIVYRDDSHITAAYSMTLAPMLLREMHDGLPVGWTGWGRPDPSVSARLRSALPPTTECIVPADRITSERPLAEGLTPTDC